MMKDYIRIMAVLAAALVILPLIGITQKDKAAAPARAKSRAASEEKIKLLFEDTGTVREMTMHDYIAGAVFAQMPADFDDEALKAQAVLAATYARSRILSEKDFPTAGLKGAVISTDNTKYQAFFTDEQAKALYGSKYSKARRRISAAADFAQELTLCYEGRPIIVAFHGISYGSTESAWDMWGEDIPYLCAVSSDTDAAHEECVSSKVIPADELKKLIGEGFGEHPAEDPDEWLSPAETTVGGTLLRLRIGDGVYPAEKFCELAGLASQHFEYEYADGSFTFTVQGCGHLVGMSQYGADAMARNGSDCAAILMHYFPGTQLIRSYDPH